MPPKKPTIQKTEEPENTDVKDSEVESMASEASDVNLETKASKRKERVYIAKSNLSSEGKSIAKAGQEIVLSDKLAEYYQKHSPGSIELVL